MKKTLSVISLLFLAGILGLVIAAFFLLLKDLQEEKLFYLNLVMSCVAIGLVFWRGGDLFGTVEKVGDSAPGYGLKWRGLLVYVPLAVLLIAASMIYSIPFKFCIIGHVALLLLLLGFFILGQASQENVGQVMSDIERRKSGLNDINSKLSLLEIACRTSPVGAGFADRAEALKEAVRFITASDNETAVSIEDKLNSKIQLITSQLENGSRTSELIDEEFNECMTLVELRKKLY